MVDIKKTLEVSGNILDMKMLKQMINEYGFKTEWAGIAIEIFFCGSIFMASGVTEKIKSYFEKSPELMAF